MNKTIALIMVWWPIIFITGFSIYAAGFVDSLIFIGIALFSFGMVGSVIYGLHWINTH